MGFLKKIRWHSVTDIRRVCSINKGCTDLEQPPPHHHNHFSALFRDHPGEPVPQENFWTLWCKGRLTEADTPTIRLRATPSGLTSAHLHNPHFFTGRMPFLPPSQQCQSTEGKDLKQLVKKLRSKVYTGSTRKQLLKWSVCTIG